MNRGAADVITKVVTTIMLVYCVYFESSFKSINFLMDECCSPWTDFFFFVVIYTRKNDQNLLVTSIVFFKRVVCEIMPAFCQAVYMTTTCRWFCNLKIKTETPWESFLGHRQKKGRRQLHPLTKTKKKTKASTENIITKKKTFAFHFELIFESPTPPTGICCKPQ